MPDHQRILARQVVEHLDHLLVAETHGLVDPGLPEVLGDAHDPDALRDRAAAALDLPLAHEAEEPRARGVDEDHAHPGQPRLQDSGSCRRGFPRSRRRRRGRPASRRTAPGSPDRWSRSGSRRSRCSRTGWPRTTPPSRPGSAPGGRSGPGFANGNHAAPAGPRPPWPRAARTSRGPGCPAWSRRRGSRARRRAARGRCRCCRRSPRRWWSRGGASPPPRRAGSSPWRRGP